MRTIVFCAASLAVALVVTDQVLASGPAAEASSAKAALVVVERAHKSDRSTTPIPVRMVPGVTIVPGRDSQDGRMARRLPDGCETAVSPLAKAAGNAPASRCVS